MIKKFVGTLLVFTYLLSLPIHAFAIDNDGDGEPKSIKKPVSYMIASTQHDFHFIFNN